MKRSVFQTRSKRSGVQMRVQEKVRYYNKSYRRGAVNTAADWVDMCTVHPSISTVYQYNAGMNECAPMPPRAHVDTRPR